MGFSVNQAAKDFFSLPWEEFVLEHNRHHASTAAWSNFSGLNGCWYIFWPKVYINMVLLILVYYFQGFRVFGHPTRNTSFWPIWGGSVDPGRIWLGSRGVPLRTAAVGRTFQHQLVQVSWSHIGLWMWGNCFARDWKITRIYIYIIYMY